MAKITPFCALRPVNALAHKIAALPYDVYTTEEARAAAGGNEYSFLRVDKAEIELLGVGLYDERVYKRAAQNLNKMIENGWLKKDEKPSLYIYRLEEGGRRQTGVVGLTSIDEYINGTIKRHELTRKDKEDDRVRHIESCGAHTGPIFLAFKPEDSIKRIVNAWTESNAPAVSFESGGVTNTVWVVDDDEVINKLISLFSGIENLYIADGHHRNAAAARVGVSMRENGSGAEAEWYNFCLSVIFPADELCILPYNRIIKDLNGKTEEDFLGALSREFDITAEERRVLPEKRHEFGMYLGGRWYRIRLKPGIEKELGTLEGLDVSVIHSRIIGPILGISDIRNDSRIGFIGGADVSEIERAVASESWRVGFSMFPTSIGELIEIADDGGIMPPKSTWFVPKLLSGLFINKAE